MRKIYSKEDIMQLIHEDYCKKRYIRLSEQTIVTFHYLKSEEEDGRWAIDRASINIKEDEK